MVREYIQGIDKKIKPYAIKSILQNLKEADHFTQEKLSNTSYLKAFLLKI